MPYTESLVKLDLRGNPPPFLCPRTEWCKSTSTACHELTNDLFVLCWRWLSKMRVPHQVKALIIYLPCPTPNRYINIFTSCNSSPQYNSLFVPGIQIMLKDNKNRDTVQCQKYICFHSSYSVEFRYNSPLSSFASTWRKVFYLCLSFHSFVSTWHYFLCLRFSWSLFVFTSRSLLFVPQLVFFRFQLRPTLLIAPQFKFSLDTCILFCLLRNLRSFVSLDEHPFAASVWHRLSVKSGSKIRPMY